MTHCPHCGKDMEVPAATSFRVDEFFGEDVEDVDVSAQEHIQLECKNCETVLGYLAVCAATGG